MESTHISGRDSFEQVLAAEGALVVFETREPDVLVEQFRLQARRSGQAVYYWSDATGLVSLREGSVSVPGCQRFADALRYMLQSMHFGIYLVDGIQAPIADVELRLLRQLVKARTNHVRRVVLMTEDPDLSSSLEGAVTIRQRDRVQFRLRDGRWVR